MSCHLAQINIARFLLPVADPANADFVANLDRVNQLAEVQPGFVWRLVGEINNPTDSQPFGDPRLAVNLSVWTDLESLVTFVYRDAAHRDIMRRRREWFDRMEFYMALWWVPAGHIPTVEEGKARIDLLARVGPTAEAFLFKPPFPAPSGRPV